MWHKKSTFNVEVKQKIKQTRLQGWVRYENRYFKLEITCYKQKITVLSESVSTNSKDYQCNSRTKYLNKGGWTVFTCVRKEKVSKIIWSHQRTK